MSTPFWITMVWLGFALLILFLPFIMSDWTSFGITLAVTVLVIWKAFRPRRKNREEGKMDTNGHE